MADLYGTTGQDTILGTNDNDRITGYAGEDLLAGFGGDDLIYGDGASKSNQESGEITLADKEGLYDISDASQVTLNLSDFTHSTGFSTSIGYYITDDAGNVIKSVAPLTSKTSRL